MVTSSREHTTTLTTNTLSSEGLNESLTRKPRLQVRQQMLDHLDMVYALFHTFCMIGSGDAINMHLNDWTEFLNHCDIVDNDSKWCKLTDCDQMFIQSNFNPNKKADAKMSFNQENAVTRYEENPRDGGVCLGV